MAKFFLDSITLIEVVTSPNSDVPKIVRTRVVDPFAFPDTSQGKRGLYSARSNHRAATRKGEPLQATPDMELRCFAITD